MQKMLESGVKVRVHLCLKLSIRFFHTILVVDPCLSNPCDTNADCVWVNMQVPNFICVCREGFTGSGIDCLGKIN